LANNRSPTAPNPHAPLKRRPVERLLVTHIALHRLQSGNTKRAGPSKPALYLTTPAVSQLDSIRDDPRIKALRK